MLSLGTGKDPVQFIQPINSILSIIKGSCDFGTPYVFEDLELADWP